MHRGKRTRIGQSNIPNAGMGLFACEFMLKGEFVIKYLGEILDSISL
jgi:SET domain-containing protein